jgi:hypothetical protein
METLDVRDPRFIDRIREILSKSIVKERWITDDLSTSEETFVINLADELIYFISDWIGEERRRKRSELGFCQREQIANILAYQEKVKAILSSSNTQPSFIPLPFH